MLSICETQCITRPNASASAESVSKLLLSLLVLSGLIALAFLHMGAWMVLPFAGLELVLVVLAFVVVMRHASDYEKITIVQDQIEIEQSVLGKIKHVRFHCYWARVTLREGENGKTSLWIGSHDQEVEFGRDTMDNAQREQVASHLKRVLLKTK
ncbi:DUF2244 domain-containing protein [Methylophilus medardicus]|uniref:DUF2244 domain-containing protein n=1 Tax=Methylophilus medardicus TaxID=2588534 RepID=A0A5B8CVZ4_9PROT|nr:DUF2244 domain-containing protein [Methylophilus medardicus]QDC45419.1 DUF2244 domain-containing protein [Methylophilus medardicus]QDC50426.1 DUF2244 domain-containing protein [Methylophilus medardicus]QDC54131.1 DUF2244 domain-containing protein [Methylophilus medardicus]